MTATASKPVRKTARKPKQETAMTTQTAAMTEQQFYEAFAEYGQIKRNLEFAAVKHQHRLAIAETRYKESVADDTARLNELENQIRHYAEAHRAELTGGKGKTAKVGAGCLKWKIRPASVQIDDADSVIATLEQRCLYHCVRTKKEVNKAAVMAIRADLADKPIDGLTFTDGAEVLTVEA